MILAGDIGGTKSNLALMEKKGDHLRIVFLHRYPNHEYTRFEDIIQDFLDRGRDFLSASPLGKVQAAGFGVAGPVRAGRSKISNLPWIIDAGELAKQLKLNSVGLLNDLEAYAYGIDGLESKDFITLSDGSEDADGNRAVISAKTGLGMAGLYWDGFRHHPFACEGGHADFAPRNELQTELLVYLQKKYGRISCERILSGPGIKNIYDFLRDAHKAEEPDWLRTQIASAPDPPALISQLALEGKSAICDQAMSIFVSVFGAQTGNCALNFMSTGGIFIGGSIAAKIVPKMKDPVFMESFLDKGRMGALLKDVPVKIVVNDDCGMIGAARYTLVQKAFRKTS